MARLMRHVSMVVLLSTALASGQAVAKPPSKLESLSSLMAKIFGSETTLSASWAATGASSGVMFMMSLGLLAEHEPSILLGGLSFAGFMALVASISANRDRQHREAYQLEKRIIEELYQQGQSEGMTFYQAATRLEETTRLAL